MNDTKIIKRFIFNYKIDTTETKFKDFAVKLPVDLLASIQNYGQGFYINIYIFLAYF